MVGASEKKNVRGLSSSPWHGGWRPRFARAARLWCALPSTRSQQSCTRHTSRRHCARRHSPASRRRSGRGPPVGYDALALCETPCAARPSLSLILLIKAGYRAATARSAPVASGKSGHKNSPAGSTDARSAPTPLRAGPETCGAVRAGVSSAPARPWRWATNVTRRCHATLASTDSPSYGTASAPARSVRAPVTNGRRLVFSSS